MTYGNKILETIVKDFFDTNIIKEEDLLVIALSGGKDSMCLFDAFYKLQSEVNYKMIALHVHHGIRGKEADRDLTFVKNYCESFNVKLISKKVAAPLYAKKNNLTLEEAARKLRYEVFENEWKNETSKNSKREVHILVAHHKSDQVETIIHNIVRGTGLKGISGMKKKSGYILRPLLDVSKKEIEKYIDEYDIPYVDDSTNDDINYTRNYIRKEIIKKLEKINKKASEHILELSKISEEVNDFIESESEKAYNNVIVSKASKEIIIDLKKFNIEHKIIKTGIIKETFKNLISTLKDITKTNIDDIIELSEKDKGGHLDLPYNITVDKKQGNLIFIKNNNNVSMDRRKKK